MAWSFVLAEEVADWFLALATDDQLRRLKSKQRSTSWPRSHPASDDPWSTGIKGSTIHNVKELRPASSGASEVRLLFVFDPDRQAVLLVAGDKAGNWQGWYRKAIPTAERRYQRWIREKR